MRFIFCDKLHWRNKLRLIHDKYCNFHELWRKGGEFSLFSMKFTRAVNTHPAAWMLCSYLFILSLHTTIWLTFEPWVTPPTLLLNHVKWQHKNRGKDWLGPKVLVFHSKYSSQTSINYKKNREQTNLVPSVLFSFYQLIATLLTSDHLHAYFATTKPSVLHNL